jgi:hypothetical protein
MTNISKTFREIFNRFVLSCLFLGLSLVFGDFQALEAFAEQRGIVPVPSVKSSRIEVTEGISLQKIYQGSYALVIGANNYSSGWPDLPGVKKDVKEVKTALMKKGFLVTVITDPTKRELEKAFDNFISQYGLEEENRLLIYFAGHGHTQKLSYGRQMGYLVPVDAPNPEENLNGFLANGMDMQQIEVYAKRIQARHAIFLFDSCFSGSFFSLNRAIPKSVQYKIKLPVRQFITSGSAGEEVSDDSVFRKMFVSALNGEGDSNQDGFLTGTELGEFLKNKVIDYTKGSQHPQYGTIRDPNLDKGDFVFSVQPQGTELYGKNITTIPMKGQVQNQKFHEYQKELAQVKREISIEEKKLALLREESKKKKTSFGQKKKLARHMIVSGKAKKMGNWIVFKNETAVDIRTRLMWMTEDFYNLEGKFPHNRDEILAWVDKMNLEKKGGFDDWRLPEVLEYQSIFNKRLERKGFSYTNKRGAYSQSMNAKPVGYPIVFKDGGGYWYWSSNLTDSKSCGIANELDSMCVKTFNFRNGQTTIRDTNMGRFFSSSVRLVRDFQ